MSFCKSTHDVVPTSQNTCWRTKAVHIHKYSTVTLVQKQYTALCGSEIRAFKEIYTASYHPIIC